MANLPKNIQNTSFRASLPAGAVAQAGFRNEAKICQTTTCTIHDMERRKMQLYENGQLVKTRIYCGMCEKETDATANVKQYCYIAGGNGVTAVLINEDLYFLRRDVQGTITGLVNQNDSIVEEYSNDAWGRRRNPTNWTYDSIPQPQFMHRGYTFHEMLDEFGLINMNGRCYDPVVGRFLSPDIIVQNPNNTQCYNRYSYAINNPLKYTDPSGWSWSPIDAARHASMIYGTSMMNLHNRFQPSIIRSGSGSRGSGFDFGSNAIVFQTTEATIEMELAAINNMLKNVFGMPGLFGNPEEDEVADKYDYSNGTDFSLGYFAEEEIVSNVDKLSSPREFAKELQYYFKYNSNTGYELSKERFDDIYLKAHENNAIEWNNLTLTSDGNYCIPVNFYKTDYDLAFGRATMIFSYDKESGFEPIGFYDLWDLDPKPWGKRSYTAEMITRYFNWQLGGGKPFTITYP